MTSSRAESLRHAPAYSLAEAAHYLRMPRATLRAWVLGQKYKSGGKSRTFRSIISIADKKRRLLSFANLVEAYVLYSLRRRFKFSLPHVRKALDQTGMLLGTDRPLLDARFETDGVALFVASLGRLVNVSEHPGQFAIREVLEQSLQRVTRDPEGVPIRLVLPVRGAASVSGPNAVEVNPSVAFGRPVLTGTGIPTAVLVERFRGGESMRSLADDYSASIESIEEAIRCEFELEAA